MTYNNLLIKLTSLYVCIYVRHETIIKINIITFINIGNNPGVIFLESKLSLKLIVSINCIVILHSINQQQTINFAYISAICTTYSNL